MFDEVIPHRISVVDYGLNRFVRENPWVSSNKVILVRLGYNQQ